MHVFSEVMAPPQKLALRLSRASEKNLQNKMPKYCRTRDAKACSLEPLMINGRRVHYRFARQRAKYLSASLRALKAIDEDKLDDVDFRDALCRLPGIGPKTASWIVRNRRGSDEVAILDVHIVRACEIMSVFPERSDPSRNYRELEARFLEFCLSARARASVMDSTMWGTMRKLSKRLLCLLIDPTGCLETSSPCFRLGEAHVRKRRQPRGLAFERWRRRRRRWATCGSVPKDPTGPNQ